MENPYEGHRDQRKVHQKEEDEENITLAEAKWPGRGVEGDVGARLAESKLNQ